MMNLNLDLDAVRGWHKEAACRDSPEDWFAKPKTAAFDRAVAICGTCPVKAACLAEGARNTHGVWGGERATGKVPPLEADCGTAAGFRLHHRRGTVPCDPCAQAQALYRAKENLGRTVNIHGGAGYRAGCRCPECRGAKAAAAAAERRRGASA
jgi:hypothetical protein